MNGPGGDLPLLLWDGSRVRVICGQGPAPAAATIDAYRGAGIRPGPGRRPVRRVRAGRVRRVVHPAAGLRFVGAGGRARLRDRLRARRVPGDARDRERDRADRARVGGLRPDLAAGGRAPAQPDAGRHLRAARRRARAVPGSADRRRAGRLVPRLGGGVAGCRLPHAGRPGAVRGRRRGAGVAALRGLDGVQDRAVGPGTRVPAATRAAARRARPVPGDRARPHRRRGREARVRGPGRVVRRLGAGAARSAALARVRGGAARADRPAAPPPSCGRVARRRATRRCARASSATPSPRAATPATWTSRTASATS